MSMFKKRKMPTEAEKLFKQNEAEKQAAMAWEIVKRERLATEQKTARLRALRLARDAANRTTK